MPAKRKASTAITETPEQEPARTVPPAWWGFPPAWVVSGTGIPGLIGPHGYAVRTTVDSLAHRGICAADLVWVNPDRPAVPDEVVLAELAPGHRILAVWKHFLGTAEYLGADGPPPWGMQSLVDDSAVDGRHTEPGAYRIVGSAVWVQGAWHGAAFVPGHAPVATEGRREEPAWAHHGEVAARVEMADAEGDPYVLSIDLAAVRRLYVPACDQQETRRLVEEHRDRALTDLGRLEAGAAQVAAGRARRRAARRARELARRAADG